MQEDFREIDLKEKIRSQARNKTEELVISLGSMAQQNLDPISTGILLKKLDETARWENATVEQYEKRRNELNELWERETKVGVF